MELLFAGVFIGLILMFIISDRFSFFQKKKLTEKQSVVLLDKIKKVSKLITIEGDFAEIYHHENVKENFLGFSSKKKAIILINAKTHIGFDFRKIQMQADNKKKKIILSYFPKPEVLSIEPDIKFYDLKNGLLNKFSSEDLTKINKEAKDYILQKIPESNLMKIASKEALETILLMESLADLIGWKLDYTAIEILDLPKKLKK